MANTLFAYLKGAISNKDDTDPETSSSFYNPPMEARHNVRYYRRETVSLDQGDTRTISIPDYASSDWSGVMARVVGEVKLTTIGHNADTIAAITGVTVGYGVERHPGYISMISIEVVSFTLEGLADGSTVEYLAMVLAQDDQL